MGFPLASRAAVANTSQELNNFTSPFFTGALTRGINGHLSSVAVVYTPSTVPTPWPILAASFGTSLLVALWAIIGGRAKLKSWPVGLALSIYLTIKSISYLVGASIAAADTARDPTGLSSTAGRFFPASQLAIATLALLPYTITSPKPWDKLAIINSVVSFTCLTLVTFLPLTSNMKSLRYAALTVVGGNCPVYVPSCSSMDIGQVWTTYAGCGAIANATEDVSGYVFDGMTVLSTIEMYVGILIFAPLIIGGGWIMLFLGIWLLCSMAAAFSELVEWFMKPTWEQDKEISDKKRRWCIALAVVQILLIIAVGTTSMIAHMSEEGHAGERAFRRKFSFIDCHGPPRNLSVQAAGESWVDCFTVGQPLDQMGFLVAWWNDTKTRPVAYLSLP
ncbi:hypothetical protein B0T16DRAFT_451497 [Cercophora newfieldiana]|uniref:Uncharacterized protein n=1 Tax=Cercophora newfieldiana TaxID=92897 RepID=A0AA39YPW0_9PEZI|nr:hypothetical protein B0T16DRAFT_451497 [Cercophora newfieldiana]